MTNIQAIDLLKDLEQSLDDYCELNDEGKTAFRMAITALELFGISEQLPSAQPEKRTEERTETHACDCISRQAAIDALHMHLMYRMGTDSNKKRLDEWINNLPSVQPEIIRCKDCIYYDPPHVENNGVRYEYDEMPADAFDALGTGLVNAEYGINIGGRCCVDYYCKNYSDDKRVFVREDNYCGRAERRTDD